jgi:hypothetical protein
VLKNLFELKAGINFTIRYNEFFNSWFMAVGTGHAIWNKTAAQGTFSSAASADPWVENTNSIYEYNVFHHLPGMFQNSGWEFCGADDQGSAQDAVRCTDVDLWYKPKGTSGLIFRHNLGYRISNRDRDADGATSTGFNGAEDDPIYLPNGCSNCAITHNTIDSTGDAETIDLASANNAAGSALYLSNGFTLRNNLLTRLSAGLDASSFAEGTASIESSQGTNATYVANTVDFNVWGGSSPTNNSYPEHNTASPVGNVFLSLANWRTHFVSPITTLLGATPFDIAGYALTAASAYNNAASDSTDIGADITTLATEIAKTRAGTP